MKIGGKDFTVEFKPVGLVDTSLGKLAVFSISAGDQGKVMGDSAKTIDPSVLANRIIPFIAHSTELLGKNEAKPDEPTLTDEQVGTLNEAEVDSILEAFIQSQEHLYRKDDSETTTDENGNKVVRLSYGDIVYPKLEGENNSQYLHRLYVLEEEKLERQAIELAKKFSKITQFSSGLQDSIKHTLQMGNSLSKVLENVHQPVMPDLASLVPKPMSKPTVAEPSLPSFDYDAIAKNAEEARWAPFNAVNERLDTLIGHTALSGKFMVEMNQTQTRIASEIKASGEDASKIGRKSLKVTYWGFYTTIVVLVLTIAGLVLSELDRSRGDDDATYLRQQAEQFIAGQQELTAAITSDRKAATTDVHAILSLMEQSQVALGKEVRAILEGQATLIQQQALEQTRDQKTIEELRRKLSELETRIDGNKSSAQPFEDGERKAVKTKEDPNGSE